MIRKWTLMGLVLALLTLASVSMAQETMMPEPVAVGAFHSNPLDVALNVDGSMAYIAFADGTLGVYALGEDGSFVAVTEPFAAGGLSFQPIGLALSPDGTMLYVANTGFVGRSLLSPITLWAVDPATGTLTSAGRWSIPSSGSGLNGIGISADGSSLILAGAFESGVAMLPLPTPERATFSVAPYKLPCSGMMPMLCLMVAQNGGEQQFFYSPIGGFEFQWGHSYELSVRVEDVANPPADASSKRYTLLEIVSDSGYQPGFTFEMELPVMLVQPVSAGVYSLNGEIEFTCATENMCSALGTFLGSGITPPTVFTFPEVEGDPLIADITLPVR
jgi:hypothetical protein